MVSELHEWANNFLIKISNEQGEHGLDSTVKDPFRNWLKQFQRMLPMEDDASVQAGLAELERLCKALWTACKGHKAAAKFEGPLGEVEAIQREFIANPKTWKYEQKLKLYNAMAVVWEKLTEK
ncbi:TPA: hypothetical protein HA278_03570 [Candidatus Woesearchaeota archaeon]|jgi:hypothetical protein|nr:hypothetical protein [archaeon]HIJ11111.1 hypothetical protein [Candidatus Woesearchaeota archaeon]